MLYSTDRILVTHAGSLPRPADLRAMVLAKSAGEPYDAAALDQRLGEAVAESVRHQRDCGIDVVNDGELSKYNFTDYVRGRIAGHAGLRRAAALCRPGRTAKGPRQLQNGARWGRCRRRLSPGQYAGDDRAL